jgi:hypothetical protein
VDGVRELVIAGAVAEQAMADDAEEDRLGARPQGAEANCRMPMTCSSKRSASRFARSFGADASIAWSWSRAAARPSSVTLAWPMMGIAPSRMRFE